MDGSLVRLVQDDDAVVAHVVVQQRLPQQHAIRHVPASMMMTLTPRCAGSKTDWLPFDALAMESWCSQQRRPQQRAIRHVPVPPSVPDCNPESALGNFTSFHSV